MRYIEQIGGRDTMIGHSMISVKAAAALLGCDKRAIREKLDQGKLKGEKRLDGDKEKWYVKRADVEKLVELASPPPLNPVITAPPPRARKKVTPTQSAAAAKPRATEIGKVKPESNDLFFGVGPIIVTTPQTAALQDSANDAVGRTPEVASQVVIESASWTNEQPKIAAFDIVDTTTVSEYAGVRIHRAEPQHGTIVDTTTISEAPLFAPSDWASTEIAYDELVDTTSARFEQPSFDTEREQVRDPYDAALNDADLYEEAAQVEPALLNVIQVMTKEFLKRMEDERSLNARLLEELELKNSQLRLLPDLQKRADELYKVEFEAAALRLQISCMQQQHFDVLVCLERAEQDTIPQLEERLEEECRQHSIEVARLEDQITLYATKYSSSEDHQKTVSELQHALFDAMEQKEREKRQAVSQIELLKRENERYRKLAIDEALLRDEQLGEIERLTEDTTRVLREKQFEIDLFVDEVDLLKQERDVAVAKLNDRLTQLASQGQNISQLETQLIEVHKENEQELLLREEEKKSLEQEAERMTQQWQSEVSSLNERLSAITDQLKESQKPWWKKWFFPTT
ncbi:MAG: hypothetical protein K2X93_17345 [Candidatus Obscuribacterales bacterium]|nr:hypothetical protein [Candidatus Obscuribacterales bacterium]